jgi:transposase
LFVDALPIEELGFSNSKLNKEGNLPYHPSDLFKLLLYGYRNGIRSAEKLSKACMINVEVMCLPTCGEQAGLLNGLRPSPRTLNYFRANNSEAIEKAHRHFVKLLKKWKLLDGKVIALDGTKVRGQNCMKNYFNAKKIQRHLDYIEGKIGDYLDQLDDEEPSKKHRKRESKSRDRISFSSDQL